MEVANRKRLFRAVSRVGVVISRVEDNVRILGSALKSLDNCNV